MITFLKVHEVLQQGPSYRLSWYNAEHTMIVLEIFDRWTWDEALVAVPLLNRLIEEAGQPVYSLYYYRVSHLSLFPRGTGLSNLRRILELDPRNEKLVFFIHQDAITRQFITLLSRVYGLRQMLHKYRFVDTWEEALHQIDADRAPQP
ncbi:MAG: hypothetical protein MUE40_13370 [Anaerolineae bacterium]|nr:hypothetical protein [Anaerolineae bacterium]